MALLSPKQTANRPKPHFMHSTEASRAQTVANADNLHHHDGGVSTSVSPPERKQFFRRATRRITNLNATKKREGRIGISKLDISSPILQHSSTSAPVRLPSPSSKSDFLPDPVKKEPIESSTTGEKPLPSLPVAAVVTRSPIQRRSLIDATEKPLRKSISPYVTRDWPTLLPMTTTDDIGLVKEAVATSESMQQSVQKPTLAENVIERMRKLDVCADSSESGEGTPTSEIKYQSDVSIAVSAHENNNANAAMGVQDPTFLDSQYAPPAPVGTPTTQSESSEDGQTQSSSKELEVSERVHGPVHTAGSDPGTLSAALSKSHASSKVPTPESSGSFLPRLSKVLPAINKVEKSTQGTRSNVPQLRRTHQRIDESILDSPSLKSVRGYRERPSQGLEGLSDRNSVIYRQSSLPIPERLIKQNRTEADPSQLSSASITTKTPADSGHAELQEHPINLESAAEEDRSDLRPNVFELPGSKLDDSIHDNQSVISRSRSISNATSGTIYAYDEFGSYRLKPVSVSNRKNGPRVRIEDAADSLLLDDESLATCNAKRKAYENRYKVSTEASDIVQPSITPVDSPEIPDEQLSFIELDRNQRNVSPFPMLGPDKAKIEIKAASKISVPTRLAPPISANIPALPHSSSTWPFQISRVAPFTQILPEDENQRHGNKRKSASDSNLRSVSPAPIATPLKGSAPSMEQSPASAYTLRTALDSSLTGSIIRKPRRSFPSVDGARSMVVPHTPLTTNNYESSSSQRTTGLRKTKSGLSKPYHNQRAAFKSSPSNADDSPVNYIVQGQNILSSTPPNHMSSYNKSVRANKADGAHDNRVASSPLATPGSVIAGRGVMSNIKGLFHKPSSDRIIKSESRGSLRMSRKSSVQNQSAVFKSSPLRASVETNTPNGMAGSEKSTPLNDARRKFTLRNREKINPSPIRNGERGARNESPILEPFVTSALEPFEIRDATSLAFALLDKARDSIQTDIQQDYIELAKLLVTTISLSRESEKAMEEARQAAARAEMETIRTRQSIANIAGKIRGMVDGQAGE